MSALYDVIGIALESGGLTAKDETYLRSAYKELEMLRSYAFSCAKSTLLSADEYRAYHGLPDPKEFQETKLLQTDSERAKAMGLEWAL